MSKTMTTFFALTALAALVGCTTTTGDEVDDDNDVKWLGSAPHFQAHGYLNGEELDLELSAEDAANPELLNCKREYEVPVVKGEPDFSQAKLVEIKLKAYFPDAGRYAEVEFKSHASDQDAPGDVVGIIPRVDGVSPAADEMWVEWEWHDLEGEDLYESAAQEGTYTVGEFTGEGDENGIVPEGEGQVGGFLSGRWSVDESVDLSFSAPCVKNKIEEVE